jgi:large subunit ribosomal protein L3
MTKVIVGKKISMTQVFDAKGNVIPVTVLEVEPNIVVQIKTKDNDGYDAIQLGTGSTRRLTKADKGHRKNLGNFRHLFEVRGAQFNDQDVKVGDAFDVSLFAADERVKATGMSKGKGFQGAVKRHGFHGMPASHGHKAVRRHVGSIGQRFPQHTLRGTRMAGRMGNEQVTIRGLKIVSVDTEHQLLAIKGAIPGNRGEIIRIQAIS